MEIDLDKLGALIDGGVQAPHDGDDAGHDDWLGGNYADDNPLVQLRLENARLRRALDEANQCIRMVRSILGGVATHTPPHTVHRGV